MEQAGDGVGRGMRLGKYEIGRTLGEGNFGKVKYARRVDTGESYAVKILERKRIQSLKIDEQIKREIGTLKLLKHPNVVRLHEVSASKTKIYMVLEYVDGGELFDKIAAKGKLSEAEGRKLFQQLIDGVSYCHDKGIYHRDLKPENVLVDSKGNIKISDFGLSALPQHLRNDGLLHTTCGSPNYIAPEVLLNRGYDGARSDIWSCGVILFVILTGYLPFEDKNIVVLYHKIFKGDTKIPKWLSPGAQNILKRILDPNPITRINISGIKANDWFKQDYVPAVPVDEEIDINIDTKTLTIKEQNDSEEKKKAPRHINAFELIGMASSLDLSSLFEKEDISERKNRFTSNYSRQELFEKMEEIVKEMGFQVQKGYGKMKVSRLYNSMTGTRSVSIAAEAFELDPSLYVVELRKLYGDSSMYRQLCAKLSDDLGVAKSQQLLSINSSVSEIGSFEGQVPVPYL